MAQNTKQMVHFTFMKIFKYCDILVIFLGNMTNRRTWVKHAKFGRNLGILDLEPTFRILSPRKLIECHIVQLEQYPGLLYTI